MFRSKGGLADEVSALGERTRSEVPTSWMAVLWLGLVVWVLGSTLLGRAFTTVNVTGSDAYLFAYIAERWLEGAVPYLDVWDNKPPGIFLVNAVAFALLSNSFFALAVVEIVVVAGAAFTVWAILRRLGVSLPGVLLGTVGCASAANLSIFNEGGNLTEVYLLWPGAASILMFIRALQEGRRGDFFLAGLFASVASYFKLTGIAPLLAECAFLGLVVIFNRATSLSALRSGGLLLCAFLLGWLPWFLYFSAQGIAEEVARLTFLAPWFYGSESQRPVLWLPFLLAKHLQPIAGLAAVAFLALLHLLPGVPGTLRQHAPSGHLRFGGKPLEWGAVIVGLWFLADMMGAMAGGRFYWHYFIALAPSISAMAGIGLNQIDRLTAFKISSDMRVTLFACAVILAPTALLQVQDVYNLRLTAKTYRVASPLLERLQQEKTADSTLFVWSYIPRLYYETGMRAPFRLTTSLNLTDSERTRAKFEEELLQTLEGSPPSFIVDEENYWRNAILQSSRRRLERLIETRYRLILKDEGRLLYERVF